MIRLKSPNSYTDNELDRSIEKCDAIMLFLFVAIGALITYIIYIFDKDPAAYSGLLFVITSYFLAAKFVYTHLTIREKDLPTGILLYLALAIVYLLLYAAIDEPHHSVGIDSSCGLLSIEHWSH
ncbi:hypothetical protein [Pseudomonas gingeri]|uniref:hypothetical protein n=1 Tax=Pseudomonas gingeri TaxID=117681 RepID=UPI0015A10F5F|nr:hypothetical protein [Pseudomonas gingeri]NWE27378.1 hypothetical protein [Pseudomonas gingeri]NWE93304.1 hypothetical protein [Pseudomonas gingeri]